MNQLEVQSTEEAGRTVRDQGRGLHSHYVYLLCGEDGMPFYVGKGSGLRFRAHEGRWGPYGVMFDSFSLDGETAFEREQEVISELRRDGLALRNVSPGGDGGFSASQLERALAGSNTPDNRRAKRLKALAQWASRRPEMLAAVRRRCQTDEFRDKMRRIRKARDDR